ncbi:hypothetical protein CPB83DRAFT_773120 [Crepidotus variabilis]|uniref:Uncharacterized protein n=1 Tax=Crepidotus variabilis TaxID=179855 RepID=A0A9P6JLP0_9AGAR|nr:hypothetical protein CPB83DRAFT_773120 [Crepidotus variabilis]
MTQQQPRVPRTRSRTRTDEKFENGEDDGERRGGDSDWEDEDDPFWPGHSRAGSPVGSTSAYVRPSPRKRRRPTFPVRGSRKQIPTLASTLTPPKPVRAKEEQDDQPLISQQDVVKGAVDGGAFVAKYSLDIVKRSLQMLKIPFSIVFMLLILGSVLSWARPTIQTALAPICILPGVSRLPICTWGTASSPSRRPQWADYPRLVEAETKTFDQLMDGFVGGGALSLEVKHAEMATQDLVSLIQISDLKAKDTLASLLYEFIYDAKKTGRGLQKLSSKVGGAVDNIMAVNDYALKSIEATRSNEPSRLMQALTPWRPRRKPTDEIVAETFEEATDVLSRNLERLILEAEVSLKNLQDLEERLNSLHELLSREDAFISGAKEDILAELWTKIGGNNKKLRNFDSHLALLKDLAKYRKQALSHVVAALQTLRGMSEDMEDMRERVAAPNLLGPTVPVEVHMKSIEMGLQRLKEGRTRAKKLEEEAMDRVMSLASG